MTNALRLLGLSDFIKVLVHERKLTAGAARALLAVPEPKRDAIARRAAADGLSVRAIEALAREPAPRKPAGAPDAETGALIERLRYRFATHVARRPARTRRVDRDPVRRRGRVAAHRRFAARRRGVIARALLAVAASTLVGASPAAPPVFSGTSVRLVQQYVGALEDGRYGDAFALLTDLDRAYFHSAADFASIFTAGRFRIVSYRVTGAHARTIFVREDVRYRDPATDRDVATTFTAGYTIYGAGTVLSVDDSGKPWRAFAPRAASNAQHVRVRVKQVSFYARRLDLVLTFENLGANGVSLAPYVHGALRDDRGEAYGLIASRDPTLADQQLLHGLRLAPHARYTGQLVVRTRRSTTGRAGSR